MQEYVAVPDGLLPKTKELARYLDLSYEHVRTLKPKADEEQSLSGDDAARGDAKRGVQGTPFALLRLTVV